MLHAIRSGATRTLPLVEATAFVDEEVLDLPGRPRVIHVPGHTAGHSGIIFEDRQALFVGDALATILIRASRDRTIR
jgi:glyoxylase-like metal-dependent hydrolase (beta-lactamase superfamily II)